MFVKLNITVVSVQELKGEKHGNYDLCSIQQPHLKTYNLASLLHIRDFLSAVPGFLHWKETETDEVK
jgi:hypothetical protein